MNTYRINCFLFILGEDGSVDVFYGDTWIRGFKIPENSSRQEFIAECEDYFAKEMVYA